MALPIGFKYIHNSNEFCGGRFLSSYVFICIWTVDLLVTTTVRYGHGYLVLQRTRISYVIGANSFALATHTCHLKPLARTHQNKASLKHLSIIHAFELCMQLELFLETWTCFVIITKRSNSWLNKTIKKIRQSIESNYMFFSSRLCVFTRIHAYLFLASSLVCIHILSRFWIFIIPKTSLPKIITLFSGVLHTFSILNYTNSKIELLKTKVSNV